MEKINMLKYLKKYEDFLNEGLSKILYHFTSFSNLLNITKENIFNASTNIGSTADLNTSNGKFFFFSATRSKSSGYNIGDVKLVLDGEKLNNKYKGFAIDYWQYSKKPEDYGDVGNKQSDRSSYIHALSSSEMEDRIVLDKPTIENASKYILEIHILIEDRDQKYMTKEDLEYVISEYKKKNIPIYFYSEKKAFLSENKNKTINPLELEGYSKEEDKYKPQYRKLRYLERVAILLSYNDEDNYNKIVKEFDLDNDKETLETFKEQLKKDKYYYFDYPDKYSMSEYNSVVGAEIHNARSNPSKEVRFLMKMLSDDLRKYGSKNLGEYIDKKLKK